MQPVSVSTRLASPNRRIKSWYLLITNDPEPQLSPARDFIKQTAASVARHHLGDAPAAQSGELHETSSLDRYPPRPRPTDFRVKALSFLANDSIRQWRNCKSAQGGPHHGRRRKNTLDLSFVPRAKRIADEHRVSSGDTAREKEIDPRAVGRGSAYRTLAARHQTRFLEVPTENNSTVRARQLDHRQRPVGRRRTLERCHPRRASPGQSRKRYNRNEQSSRHRGTTARIASPCTRASRAPKPRTTRPKTV